MDMKLDWWKRVGAPKSEPSASQTRAATIMAYPFPWSFYSRLHPFLLLTHCSGEQLYSIYLLPLSLSPPSSLALCKCARFLTFFFSHVFAPFNRDQWGVGSLLRCQLRGRYRDALARWTCLSQLDAHQDSEVASIFQKWTNNDIYGSISFHAPVATAPLRAGSDRSGCCQ